MSYVQNEIIRALRERKAMPQKQLAEKLCISDKTIAGHHGPLQKRGHGMVYAYCNRDGLFSRRL